MKKILVLFCAVLSLQTFAQLTVPPNGGNKKAMVAEQIGLTNVTIQYHRPGVKGREDAIFGELVPLGFNDPGFGTSKAAPWRAGANENTTIEFSTDVKIEGKPLAAGKYGFFVVPDPENCIIIFSKTNQSWGSYFYNDKDDALRVIVTPKEKKDVTEWLTYEFTNQTPNTAVVQLVWEKWQLPFKVEVDLDKTQMETFLRELRTPPGFEWRAYNQAARYSLNHNYELSTGLMWAEQSITLPFIGEANFTTLSTKAAILEKMGKADAAAVEMRAAIQKATTAELHAYGRQLLTQKKVKEAMEAFQLNYNNTPGTFTTNAGMATGFSAMGNYKKALEYAKKALALAPDNASREALNKGIGLLKEGKEINL